MSKQKAHDLGAPRRHKYGHHVPQIEQRVLQRSHRILSRLIKSYFRSEIRGTERLPTSQTIIVTHHDGGMLPINGICFGVHWYDQFGFDRPLYVLTHDALHSLWDPFSKLMADSGLLRADRRAMDAVLATGQSVLLFPGAARESFRSFWKRRDIDLGGRKGFVAQAIRWGLPITPIVSAGAHETVIVLSSGQKLAERLRIPKIVRSADVLPLVAGFPWGVWAIPFLPQIPIPAKITTEVLAPIHLSEALGRDLRPEDAHDETIVQAGFDLVLTRMRQAIDQLYDERKYPFVG
ncbi:MAG: 1-acyl-sn-glycerol-3-phosphate acyltransferase [Polyangiaceae bacterium]|nr:1-acyl-sn-glycerol-3-phosphate acyltransferase [Polyangiaceae bacterium]